MNYNKKKSIRLQNNTKYFNPDTCRAYVNFSSPDTYESRQIKIEGYESRIYWHFKYLSEHNGQTFFYTLTYNDAHMPKYMGMNCFDYEDLRDLLTGGFNKRLLRNFGTQLKYFVGAELGDGKGERGLHNNPHYHILFFLEDAHNERFPYKKILPEQFRHLVRMYWQGFDEDEGRKSYKEAKYGICKEGDNIGLVTDFRAIQYVAKYVCKDAHLKAAEGDIRRKLWKKYVKQCNYDYEFHRWFYDEYLFPKYNCEVLEPQEGEDTRRFCWTIKHLAKQKYDEAVAFQKWYSQYIDEQVRLGLNEYRNRYCNKCRISQGIGDEALNHIDDLLEPTVQVPDKKKGFKNRPICMYYWRKLYQNVVKDEAGSNIRVLNDLGREYMLHNFPKRMEKKVQQARKNITHLINNDGLYDTVIESDINTSVFLSKDEFFGLYGYLLEENNIEETLKRYGEYKLVYEDRFFRIRRSGHSEDIAYPDIDSLSDYSRFIEPSIFSVTRSDIRLDYFLSSVSKGYMAYDTHPYFLPYLCVFSMFDLLADYFFVKGDDKKQQEAEERAAVKRFHDMKKVKEFYAHFE